MNNKKAPVVIKRDTTVNWLKAKNFKPGVGTICIYDNEDGSMQLKIGDGETLINDLPDILKNNSSAKVDGNVLSF